MPTGYYLGFDVCKINTSGVMQRQPNQVVNVHDLTNDVSLGTISANSAGVVSLGSLSVDPGTLVKFSVTGYAPFITRSLTNTPEYIAVPDIALVIENLYVPDFLTPAYNDIYIRNGSNSEALKVGRIAPGETLQIAYNPALDVNVEVYAIARTAQGASDTFDLANAVKLDVTPNRETATPDFSQNGIAQNALIQFIASNFSVAKFRRVQTADDIDFTVNLELFTEGNNTQVISPNFSITRTTDLSVAKTKYVRIAHSTNTTNFGAWSATKTVIFPNAAGSGGSSGGNPPTHLYGLVYFGASAVLHWQNNGGSSLNIIYQNDSPIDTVSAGTDNYGVTLYYGLNRFYIDNGDGQTNIWEYYNYEF